MHSKTWLRMQWLPFIVYLFPVIAGFAVTSTAPAIFGRYSISLFTLNLLNICFYPLYYWFSKKQHLFGKCVVLVSMCFATVLGPQNMQMTEIPFMALGWSLVRLACGISLLPIGFRLLQLRGLRHGPPILLVACLMIGFSTVDVVIEGYPEMKRALALSNARGFEFEVQRVTDSAGINAWLRENRVVAAGNARDRGLSDNFLQLDEDYLVYRPINPEDVLIVGDSVLGGQGVGVNESYRVRLEQILSQTGSPAKVHALAMPGAGLPQYLALLKLLPDGTQLDRVVLAIQLTDFPLEAPQVPDADKSSKPSRTYRIVADFVYRLRYGGYASQLLHSALTPWFHNVGSNEEIDIPGNVSRMILQLDPVSSSFQQRLQFVGDYLSRFRELAAKHSKKPPILVIFPLLISFDDYPLEAAHTILREIAFEAGFYPLDLFPIYKTNQIDGVVDRSTQLRKLDYTHPNARVHNLVAEQLASLLD